MTLLGTAKSVYREASGFGMQIFLSFCFGILLSPWTAGILYTLIFFAIWEAVVYVMSVKYSLLDRAVILASYFFGFAFGRILAQEPIIT